MDSVPKRATLFSISSVGRHLPKINRRNAIPALIAALFPRQPGLEPYHCGEAIRTRRGQLGPTVCPPLVSVYRVTDLPDRPLPGQGDGAEPDDPEVRLED